MKRIRPTSATPPGKPARGIVANGKPALKPLPFKPANTSMKGNI